MLGIDLVIPDLSYLRERPDRSGLSSARTVTRITSARCRSCTREHRVPTYATPFAHALVEREARGARARRRRSSASRPGDTLARRPVRDRGDPHHAQHRRRRGARDPDAARHGRSHRRLQVRPDAARRPRRPTWRASPSSATPACCCCSPTRPTSSRPGVTPSERTLDRQARGRRSRARAGACWFSTFASHLHRIQQVLDISARSGRRVAVVGRGMVQNVETGQRPRLSARSRPACSSTSARPATLPPDAGDAALDRQPGRADVGAHPHRHGRSQAVKIEPGDTVILSSRIIPGNERAISNVINHLCRRGAEVLHEPHRRPARLGACQPGRAARSCCSSRGRATSCRSTASIAISCGTPRSPPRSASPHDDVLPARGRRRARDRRHGRAPRRADAVGPRLRRRQGRRRRRRRRAARPPAPLGRRLRPRDPRDQPAHRRGHLRPGPHLARLRVRGRQPGLLRARQGRRCWRRSPRSRPSRARFPPR